jgi:hypothetical protein
MGAFIAGAIFLASRFATLGQSAPKAFARSNETALDGRISA